MQLLEQIPLAPFTTFGIGGPARWFAEAQDEATLVERFGHDVYVVLGSERNLKITRPADMDLARFYLQQEQAHS